MLASALLALVALGLLEGIGVAARIAHENAQLLEADAVAWDAVWKKFNENYDEMDRPKTASVWTFTETLAQQAAPGLYLPGSPAKLTLRIEPLQIAQTSGILEMKAVSADVEWGPAAQRVRLSDSHPVFVYRSDLGRTTP